MKTAIYDRPDMQHLAKPLNTKHVIAWHTSLDIQAVRTTDDREALVIGGQEVKDETGMPAQSVVYLASILKAHAKTYCFHMWGVRL